MDKDRIVDDVKVETPLEELGLHAAAATKQA